MKRTNPLLVWTLAGLVAAVIVVLAFLKIFFPDGPEPAPADDPTPAETLTSNESVAETERPEVGEERTAPTPSAAADSRPPERGLGGILSTFIVLLLLANLLLSALLYRGKVRVGKTGALVPQEWANHLTRLEKESTHLRKAVHTHQNSLTAALQQEEKATEELRETLQAELTAAVHEQTQRLTTSLQEQKKATEELRGTFQADVTSLRTKAQGQYDEIIGELAKINRELDRKDAEIDRLREGYDLGILKKHTLGVIHLYRTVTRQREKIVEAGNDPKLHDALLLFLDEMLDHLNVMPDQPASGKPLDQHPYPLEIEAEEMELTDDPSRDGCIATCLEPGFVDPDTTPPFSYRRAKVRLYRYQPAEVVPADSPAADEEIAPAPPAASEGNVAPAPASGTTSPEPPAPTPPAERGTEPEAGPADQADPMSPSPDSESPRS